MKRKITETFARALRGEIAVPVTDVHFHSDVHGRVYVCDHSRCDSVALTERELV